MRYGDHNTCKRIQIIFQNRQCRNIYIIGNLVKQQHVWSRCEYFQKIEALLFTTGKLLDWCILHGSIKQKLLKKF